MKRVLVTAVLLTTLLASIAPAYSLQADYMDRDASGNAAYESMVIHPEAIFDPDAGTSGKTFIAYQGFGLDPYVAAYDHAAAAWEGPIRVGDNPLIHDYHGGPSLVVDAQGYVNVFYGAHGSGIRHSVSKSPHDVSAFDSLGAIKCTNGSTPTGTYPQPLLVGGEMRVFFRVRQKSNPSGSDDGAWAYVASTTGAAGSWTPRATVIGVRDPIDWGDYPNHKSLDSWYANFTVGPDGTVHSTFHWRDVAGNPDDMYTRWDLYYARLDPGETQWKTASGDPLPAIDDDAEDPPYAECKIWESGDAAVNQMVVRGDDDGVPSIVFLSETTATAEPDDCTWRYMSGSRLGSDEVTFTGPAAIMDTDDFFDAADLDLSGPQPVAYLTTGGQDDPLTLPSELYPGRGGDITRWVRDAGGVWTLESTVRASSSSAERYNDPQLVSGAGGAAPHPDARLMFSEWDNDGANFIHKVFLWGSSGFLGREFTPDAERLAGRTRVETAVEVSERAFPNGSDAVLVASKMDFPDVLCGAPLAQSYKAPILLSSKDKLDSGVLDEIYRLFTRSGLESSCNTVDGRRLTSKRKVIILGGYAAVSKSVEDALESALGSGDQVSRVAGADRYETAAKVAAQVKSRMQAAPGRVVIASGESFPDALVVSPLAARKAWPILLTKRDGMPSATINAIRSMGATKSIIVGSEAAVSSAVATRASGLGVPVTRLGGPTRYDTALAIARYAQGLVPGSERVLTEERFVLASGEDFPDGLAGGVLAARFRATMLITSRNVSGSTGKLPGPTESWAAGNRDGVLDAYVLGGTAAVSSAVETRLMSVLLAQ